MRGSGTHLLVHTLSLHIFSEMLKKKYIFEKCEKCGKVAPVKHQRAMFVFIDGIGFHFMCVGLVHNASALIQYWAEGNPSSM